MLNFKLSIPKLPNMDGWKSKLIKECGEELVPLGAFSHYPQIFTDSIYFGQHAQSSPYNQAELEGALLTVFVRESIAEKLAEVAAKLPDGYSLMVWDAYRPLSVQNALYADYVEELKSVRGYSQEQAEKEAPTFVNLATDDPNHPSPHHTGGSVDLTIIKFDDDTVARLKELDGLLQSSDWKVQYSAEMERQSLFRNSSHPIDVGARFDQADNESAVRYFEEKLEKGEQLSELEIVQSNNRRWLQNLMRSVGFSSFASEWWHFDMGNQFHSKQTSELAKYGPIKLSQANKEWEVMRVGHYKGTNKLANVDKLESYDKLGRAVSHSETIHTAHQGAKHGRVDKIKHPEALRLEA